MKWSIDGGEVILRLLRVAVLSGVWDAAYREYPEPSDPWSHGPPHWRWQPWQTKKLLDFSRMGQDATQWMRVSLPSRGDNADVGRSRCLPCNG